MCSSCVRQDSDGWILPPNRLLTRTALRRKTTAGCSTLAETELGMKSCCIHTAGRRGMSRSRGSSATILLISGRQYQVGLGGPVALVPLGCRLRPSLSRGTIMVPTLSQSCRESIRRAILRERSGDGECPHAGFLPQSAVPAGNGGLRQPYQWELRWQRR